MQEESELIYSPLQRTNSTGGKSVDIQIYRLPETGWTAEVVDEHGHPQDEVRAATACIVTCRGVPVWMKSAIADSGRFGYDPTIAA